MTGKGNDQASSHFGAVTGMVVSADGKSVLTLAEDNTVRTWDASSAAELRKAPLPTETDFGILLGFKRALVCTKEGSLSVWDCEKEKELVKIKRDRPFTQFGTRYYPSRDGQSLLTVDYAGLGMSPPRTATMYSLKSGAVSSGVEGNLTKVHKGEELVAVTKAPKGQLTVATIAVEGGGFGVPPPSRYLLRCQRSEKDAAIVWETKATAQRTSGDSNPFYKEENICQAASFSPDDRAILTYNSDEETAWVALLETATGHERNRILIPVQVDTRANFVYAFSKNGDLLAVGTKEATTAVVDIRRGKVLATLKGEQGEIRSLAFGVDVATLFTGGSDGTVLVWDLREHLRKSRQAVKLTSAETKHLWTELANPDTIKAYRAVGAMVIAPAQAIDQIRDSLKPVRKVPAADIEKLIADLDSDEFETRQRAYRELRQVGLQAKTVSQKCFESSKSAEQRRLLKDLLAEWKDARAETQLGRTTRPTGH